LNYLFRTTVVPGLVGEEDILKISRWLEGSPVFQIQQFSPAATLDAEFMKIKPYGLGEIQKMAEIAKPFFTEVRIEGA
jgi:pyruvate formate lyase activating enzyme